MKVQKIILLPAVMLILASCGTIKPSDSTPVSTSTTPVSTSTTPVSTSTTPVIPENISAVALASIQGAVKFQGTVQNEDLDYPEYSMEYELTTIYEDNHYYTAESSDGAISYELNAVNNNGDAYAVEINQFNEIAQSPIKYDGEIIEWEYFENPLANLAVASFTKGTDGKFSATGTAAADVAYALYGYDRDINVAKLTVASDKVTKIEFESQEYYDDYEDTIIDKVSVIVTDHGSAKVPAVVPYVTVEEHADLANALAQIGHNVTANIVEVTEPLYEEEVSETYLSKLYFTENEIYDETEYQINDDDENPIYGSFGYLNHENTAYEYVIDDSENLALSDVLDVNFDDLLIDYSDMVVAFFEYKGNGLFEAYTKCLSFAAAQIGVTSTIQFADSISIKLTDEGDLESISYHYIELFWEIFPVAAGDVTITFTDSETTIIPIDTLALRAQLDLIAQVPNAMMGTWTGEVESTEYTVIVNAMGVTINNTPYEIISVVAGEVNISNGIEELTLSIVSGDEDTLHVVGSLIDVNLENDPFPGYEYVAAWPTALIYQMLEFNGFPAFPNAEEYYYSFDELNYTYPTFIVIAAGVSETALEDYATIISAQANWTIEEKTENSLAAEYDGYLWILEVYLEGNNLIIYMY